MAASFQPFIAQDIKMLVQDVLEDALQKPLMQQLQGGSAGSYPQAFPLARQLQYHILSNLSRLLRCARSRCSMLTEEWSYLDIHGYTCALCHQLQAPGEAQKTFTELVTLTCKLLPGRHKVHEVVICC